MPAIHLVKSALVAALSSPLQMPGTLVFDYPSVNAVTEYLTAQMLKSAAAAAAASGSAETAAADDGEADGAELALDGFPPSTLVPSPDGAMLRTHALAVLAVVARPLVADSLAAGGALGLAGVAADAIQRVPFERWDLDQAEALLGDPLTLSAQVLGCWGGVGDGGSRVPCGWEGGCHACQAMLKETRICIYNSLPRPACVLQFGAFMQDVDHFDAAAHGLSASEAVAMDPQHRWAGVVG